MKQSTIRTNLSLRNERKNVEGLVPVYMRMFLNDTDVSFSTGIWVNPVNWKKTACYRLSNKPEEQKERLLIDNAIKKLEGITEDLIRENESFNAKMVLNIFLGVEQKRISNTSLFDVWEIFSKNFMEKTIQHNLTKGVSNERAFRDAKLSHNKYNSVKQKMVEFLKKRKLTDIPLKKLDDGFQQDFLIFLQGCLYTNTAIKYFHSFNYIIRFAVKRKLLKEYPFTDDFNLRMKKSRTERLTVEELNTILNKKFATERLNVVKDIFLFMNMTGFSYGDLMSLNVDHIIQQGKKKIIMIDRKKTGIAENVPLIPEAESLIKKYSNHPECVDGRLFPARSNDKMNEYLKEIASICGIEKTLSTRVSRKTFGSILLDNNVPLVTISKLVGHSRTSTTEQFYLQADTSNLEEGMKGFKGVFQLNKKTA